MRRKLKLYTMLFVLLGALLCVCLPGMAQSTRARREPKDFGSSLRQKPNGIVWGRKTYFAREPQK